MDNINRMKILLLVLFLTVVGASMLASNGNKSTEVDHVAARVVKNFREGNSLVVTDSFRGFISVGIPVLDATRFLESNGFTVHQSKKPDDWIIGSKTVQKSYITSVELRFVITVQRDTVTAVDVYMFNHSL
jgi:hypothetical protein